MTRELTESMAEEFKPYFGKKVLARTPSTLGGQWSDHSSSTAVTGFASGATYTIANTVTV